MGQALVQAVGPDTIIVGGSERAGSDHLGQDLGALAGLKPLGVLASPTAAGAAAEADVWIDFTVPAANLDALDSLARTPVRAVIIGTTGFTPEQDAALAIHATRFAIVKAGNFSLGVNLLLALVEQAASRLGPDWDIEISEAHHRGKIDAPSGTALMLGAAAAQGRKARLSDLRSPPHHGASGPRQPGAIGFSVTRAGGVIGDHTALFGSEHEILTLGHRALDRSIFARGALHAARWAVSHPPGLYAMRDVLGI